MPQIKVCCPKQTDFSLDQTLTNVTVPLSCPVVPDTIELRPGVTTNSFYGVSIAISADGLTMVVGAPLYVPIEPSRAVGAVFIYRKRRSLLPLKAESNQFKLQQILFSPDLVLRSYYGIQVALSANGRRLLVGAPSDNVETLLGAGSVYVYDLSGQCSSCYSLSKKLIAQRRNEDGVVVSDAIAGGYFGGSLALSGDGNVAMVASALNEPNETIYVEKVYFYAADPASACNRFASTLEFAQVVEFDAVKSFELSKETITSFFFGYALSLSFNGSVAVIGAPKSRLSPPSVTLPTGAAYVYKRLNCERNWLLTQVFLDRRGPAVQSAIGGDVFVTPDGKQLFSFSPDNQVSPYFTAIYTLQSNGQYKLIEFVNALPSQITSMLERG